MENSKFKLSGGYGYTIFMALLCVINVGLAPLLIILSIIRKEGVASLIGMCVLALVVLGIVGLPTVLNGVLAPHYYAITVPALIFSFLLIIPVMIFIVKGARKLNKKIVYSDKNVSFDVTPKQVCMDGKKVTIKMNEVSGCFDIYTGKLKGYTVEWGSTKEFRNFLDEHVIPYEEYRDWEE